MVNHSHLMDTCLRIARRDARGWFVCDDDGNVISEEKNIEDAQRKLDEFNDDLEN